MEQNKPLEVTKEKPEPILKNKIRLDIVFFTLVKNWKKFILPALITPVVTYMLVLCIPRYYSVRVMLAPEYEAGNNMNGGIGGLASQFGLNFGSVGAWDAIAPTFYPDLMKSTDFLVPLLYVHVTTSDSSFSGQYMDYLGTQVKAPFWVGIPGKIKNLFKSKTVSSPQDENYRANPFALTEDEFGLVSGISGSISCSVDKKTNVITLQTTAQDPLVAALMADTVKQRLQDFIIDYRTNKTRNDLIQVQEMCRMAYEKYQAAQLEYAQFVDSHRDISTQLLRGQKDNLASELELAKSAYVATQQRLLMAKSKLQESMPVFTSLQNASVPVLPAGPKRMLIVIAFTFLALVATAVIVVVRRKE